VRGVKPHLVLGTITVLAGSVAALGGSLAGRIVLARVLDPERLGILFFAIAIVSSAGGLAELGLYSATTRRIAELLSRNEHPVAAATARTSLATAVTSGGFVTVLLVTAGPAIAKRLGAVALAPILPVLAPMATGLAMGIALWGISQGYGDVLGRAVVRDASGSMLRLTGIIAAALAGGTLVLLAGGFMAGAALGELAFLVYAVRHRWFAGAEGWWDWQLLRELPPYAGVCALGQLQSWADMLIIGVFAEPAEVGLYGIARGLAQLPNMVWNAAEHRFLPMASAEAALRNERAVASVYAHTRRLMFSLLWPVLAVCLMLPGTVIEALFGPAYAGGATALQLLSGGFLFQAILGYNEPALVAMNRPAAVLRIGAAGTAVALVSMIVLVPRFGAAGAAAGVLAGTTVRAGAAWWLLRRITKLAEPGWRFLGWVLGAAVPAVAVAGALRLAGVEGWPAIVLTGAAAAPAAVILVGPDLVTAIQRKDAQPSRDN